MNKIIENELINVITKNYKRSPLQMNKLQESDAEIINLENSPIKKIAITTDSIAEEIRAGLYDDPYLIGWMAVVVNLSDLAAVGAKPLGILISEVIPENASTDFLKEVHRGIKEASEKHDTYILGGDTNFGQNLILTGCALGFIENPFPIMRTGIKEGDLLYSSGLLGSGNAFAIAKLLSEKSITYKYLPKAKIKEGQFLTDFATSCMDTSDGVISTLDQLMRLNNIGFRLNPFWAMALEDRSRFIAQAVGIPDWLLLAGQHGEFELIFTIKEQNEMKFLSLAAQNNWAPIKLGTAISKKDLI
ncbi:MAG: thiamine-phosphate kinase, partial [Melioribacteraceae bacterium]|nr:thiamine-phosphate kinase [Melioribacteraceae bacterium]